MPQHHPHSQRPSLRQARPRQRMVRRQDRRCHLSGRAGRPSQKHVPSPAPPGVLQPRPQRRQDRLPLLLPRAQRASVKIVLLQRRVRKSHRTAVPPHRPQEGHGALEDQGPQVVPQTPAPQGAEGLPGALGGGELHASCFVRDLHRVALVVRCTFHHFPLYAGKIQHGTTVQLRRCSRAFQKAFNRVNYHLSVRQVPQVVDHKSHQYLLDHALQSPPEKAIPRLIQRLPGPSS
mmetsp:Transcript_85310/g.228108  ORF Transcript_85310/g.228108 Transcript_85310/m.228108 type:complete len:233 (+) Transcript_85310:647-1345(+)